MKKIIIPTDFSQNAWNALKYAVNLANKYQSEIHLLNIYEPISSTGSFISIKDFMQEDAEKGLKITLKELQAYLKPGTTIVTKALLGKTVPSICRYAKSMEADLIIMGTQGASGLKAVFFGSNTSGVMKQTDVPLLAIPGDANYRPIKSIAMAIDSEVITDEDVLEPVLQLAKTHGAKINVVHIEKAGQAVLIDAGVDVFLSEVPHTFYAMESDNIKEGITEFVERKEADLLVMIRRDRSFLGSIFHESVTQKTMFDSNIPLLILSN